MSFRSRVGILSASLLAMLAMSSEAASPDPIFASQGTKWTPSTRMAFYIRDQGSRIMPYRWMVALKQANGAPFLAESLSRYGYVPNGASSPPGLPVGFTVSAGDEASQAIGMTCAACHTRQIVVNDTAYRIDGGPAIVDFQAFLTDLDAAVHTVLEADQNFDGFATMVLGAQASGSERAELRSDVDRWYLRFHTLVKASLPSTSWGPSRVDAVGMIFNRLTALDIGPPPTYLIPENIHRADAPVRYPFLWNAATQDKTQWPGFAENGSDLLGLARNLGEVYGVFAEFHPSKSNSPLLNINYWNINSANFQGLQEIEHLIRKLGPPQWPWSIDKTLAKQGKAVFSRRVSAGGCAECHGMRPGTSRLFHQTWDTPIQDVGTDSREYDVLGWPARTGVLDGAVIPLVTEPLQPTDKALNILKTVVTGSIAQYAVEQPTQSPLQVKKVKGALAPREESLRGIFRSPGPEQTVSYAYESRVLQGIWAAAPYLHNGSVPTLADLLKPAVDRPVSFKVGPQYDSVKVGLATEQSKFEYVLVTTDCSDRNSGNSRCGHEFGTNLSADDKKALLEYLKSL